VRRFVLAVLVLCGVLALSGCQVVMIGFPLDTPGATPVDTPASSSVPLPAPLVLSPVLTQNSCATTRDPAAVPDLAHATCYRLGAPFLTVRRLDAIDVLPVDGTLYWTVDLKLTPTDSQVMGDWTAQNVGKQLAMVSSGAVVAEPMVQGPIVSDDVQISGPFNQTDAAGIKQHILGR
jgi:preprotein translocase subunit SecD